ncbi:cytochrome P450 [Wolfiporia cocos MD-104 SS10]|uniref:Cytochrome P450 n=1 Tax=Wolfiporia cocos (strain MD-104) TaxID=742152 RepID=A0A2H3IZV7_WOLCO|nr:cytochrome P450 [Wolfiporia cocos MD-104 SS10]
MVLQMLAALVVFTGCVFWISTKRRDRRLPPGPCGRPLLGHYGMLPKTNIWTYFHALSKQYGNMFRIRVLGHDIVVVGSFDAADALLHKQSNRYSNKPRRRMGELSGLTATLPFMDPGPLFQNARKLFRQELGPRALTQYYHDIERTARSYAQTFVSDPNCECLEHNIDRSMGVLFMKVASGYVVNDDDDDRVLAPVKQLADFAADVLGGMYSIIDRIPLLSALPLWAPGTELLRLAESWRKRLHQIADANAERVREELTSGSPSTSFMGNLYSNSEEFNFDEEQFEFIAVTMTAGGMLPLQSASLTFLTAMARYPGIQKKAQAEVDRVLGGNRLPLMSDRQDLPYVSAIILEVLRWVPLAPLLARNVLEDDEYEGYLIPKGATIVANNWSITRDPKIYPEPHIFRPERFLSLVDDSQDPTTEHPLDPREYAFGYGRRICPGLDFAEAILFMNITHILAVFDILPTDSAKTPTSDEDIEMKTVGAACRVESVQCVLRPRSADALALLGDL